MLGDTTPLEPGLLEPLPTLIDDADFYPDCQKWPHQWVDCRGDSGEDHDPRRAEFIVPNPIHWVGDAPTSLHGNGAASFERTTRDTAEVTCTLCRTLLERAESTEADDNVIDTGWSGWRGPTFKFQVADGESIWSIGSPENGADHG